MGTRASNWVDPSSSGGRGGDFSCEGRVSRFEILGRKRTRRGRCFHCPEEFPPGPVERILYEWLFLCHVSSPNGRRRKHPTKNEGRLAAPCPPSFSRPDSLLGAMRLAQKPGQKRTRYQMLFSVICLYGESRISHTGQHLSQNQAPPEVTRDPWKSTFSEALNESCNG